MARRARTSRAVGRCEPGGRLGRRPHSRPASLVCFVWRWCLSRVADHREAARSLAAGDDSEVRAFGRGSDATGRKYDWSNNLGCDAWSEGEERRDDEKVDPLTLTP